MSKEQELIDITFELTYVMFDRHEYFKTLTVEERMGWVADQLKKCGFPTKPSGISWGVLCKD